jgi:probable addiction module antidote protein
MRKSELKIIREITGSYEDYLIETLKDKEAACAYLQAALDNYQKDQHQQALLLALKDVAKAQGGIGWLAKQTHLNREHLYYLLSGKGNPKLDTLSLILKAFGFHLNVVMA